MPISISNGSGRPFIRFSPSTNAWVSSTENGPVEFTPSVSPMAIDIEHIELGWLTLSEGSREWLPWPNRQRTPSPTKEAKAGFSVLVTAPKLFGEGVFEFSSNGTASTRFVQNIFNQCEPNFGKGNVPLVQITGSRPVKVGKGSTREIEFVITKWVPRPEALIDAEGAAPAPIPATAPPIPPRAAAPIHSAFADAEF